MFRRLKSLLIRHRKSAAIAGSIALHLAVILAFLMPSSSSVSSKLDQRIIGDNDQEGVDVTLINPGHSKRVTEPNALSAFTPMVEPSQQDGWKPLDAPKPTNALGEMFAKDAFAENPQQATTTKQSDQDAHIKVNGRTNKTLNDLWKAIEPCWKRVADRNTESVTLSVSFSPLGNLAKPPVIVRAAGVQSSEQRLRSESEAISALAQCGPYIMAFGQDDVRVEFPSGH